MSKHDETELPSVDAIDLADVTGGNHRPGHNDAKLQAALAGISNSIKSVAAQKKNNSSNGITQLLPLLMMARGGGGAGCPGR